MMIHDKYREWRDGRIREEQEGRLAERAARLAAEETIARFQVERAAQQAWNERRLHAQEAGETFDEPMPNGQPLNVAEVLRDERDAWLSWYERRIAAAEKGEPFDEPPPNGANGL